MAGCKKKILFVGSFKDAAKDGSVGGQMFACKAIINSNISELVDWTLIDSTADSNILASSYNRIIKAFARLFRFLYKIIFFKYDFVLIFSGNGWSFWEKGLMSIIAKYISRSKVIIAPRSGFIINDLSGKGTISKFIKFVFNKVDIVICQSKLWKCLFEEFSPNIKSAKFIIIENIIDFNKYASLPVKEIKENEKVIILFLAWVTKNKGIFELVEAAKMLKKELINFHLIIAGKGEDFEKVKKEINISDLSDCVNLEGWVRGERKLEILSKSDIFVLPTYFEGYPNSLVEAMASAKACIATKIGSIPDIINNMESGILIEKENHIQLYQELKLLIENPILRREISLKARARVKEINSLEVGISRFKDLLN